MQLQMFKFQNNMLYYIVIRICGWNFYNSKAEPKCPDFSCADFNIFINFNNLNLICNSVFIHFREVFPKGFSPIFLFSPLSKAFASDSVPIDEMWCNFLSSLTTDYTHQDPYAIMVEHIIMSHYPKIYIQHSALFETSWEGEKRRGAKAFQNVHELQKKGLFLSFVRMHL